MHQREIGPVEKIGRGEHVSEQIPGIAVSTFSSLHNWGFGGSVGVRLIMRRCVKRG